MDRMPSRTSFAAACLTLAFPCLGTVAAPSAPPNVLVILTDDQRWDELGVVQREQGNRARFPFLQTPHLDRLAAGGARFRNAFVVHSLCSPSRAAFLTGLYGHRNGVLDNRTPFAETNLTWAARLRDAGYATAYFGKWHMGTQTNRPGFDHVASFLGQGVYQNCRFLVNGQPTATTGYVDDVTTDFAIEFLRRNAARRFAALVGFKAAHGPFEPPPRRARDYEHETPRLAPNFTSVPPYRRAVGPPTNAVRRPSGPAPATWLNHLRCVAGIDDNVGRLMNALEELGLTDRTFVVFAGDNGFYLGEHGLGDKRTAYEESIRIPLLVRYPPSVPAGMRVDDMVLNVDLMPTILDYVGLDALPGLHGRSWRPLLSGGRPDDWRRAWFYVYTEEHGFGAPFTTAVRTQTAKLIRYPGREEWTELYDLAADPYETRNLWNEPAAAELRRALETEYERQRAAVGFDVALHMPRSSASGDSPRSQSDRRRAGGARRPTGEQR